MENREPISRGQGNEFLNKLEDAGLYGQLAQKVIGSKGNDLAIKVVKFIECGGIVGIDPRFSFLKSFNLTIPLDYAPATRLDTFKEKHREEFKYGYNDNITDKNFSNVSHQLIPGKTYLVKFYGITKRVSSEDCLAVYKVNKAYYTGAQGASVLYEYTKGGFIKGKWHCSFDEKDKLPIVGDCRRVPIVYALSDGDFGFLLGGFGYDWDVDFVLVLFCDCDESA